MSLFPASISYGLFGYGGYGMPAIAPLMPEAPTEAPEPSDPIDRPWGILPSVGRGWFPGFDKAPPPGLTTWWMMRRYATIVFAHTLVTAPILAGTQTVEVVNDGDGEAEKWKAEAAEDLLPPLVDVLPAALECLHFGYWLQPVDWTPRNGRLTPKFESLLPGEAVLFRDRFRRFAGFKVGAEERDARYGFLAVNNPHIDPIFGESRNDACREEWWRARQSNANADRVENKASGIQMMIGLPMGQSFVDDKGNPIMGKAVAQAIVDAAAQGQTFQVPLTPFRKDDIKNKPELAGIEAVKVTPFDWKDNAPSLLAHLKRLGDLNVDIVRAWHRPEREGMQGQHGTQAEAGEHGAIGTTDSELVAGMVLRQYNAQVTDRWLLANKGPDAVGRLRVVQAPLSDPQQDFLQKLAQTFAQDSATGPDFGADVDKRALLDRCEVPLLSEEQAAANRAEAQAKKDAADKQKAEALKATQQANGNGDGVPVKIAASANGNGHGHGWHEVARLARVFDDLNRNE